MPPFHNTAARCTFPIEQTNDKIATIGPMIGPHSAESSRWRLREKLCQNVSGTQEPIAPSIKSPITRSRRIAAHSMTNTCATDVTPAFETSLAPKRSLCRYRHVHRRMAFHRSGHSSLGLFAGRVDEPLPDEQPE